MSKHFEEKKQAALSLKKFYSALDGKPVDKEKKQAASGEKNDPTFRFKYQELKARYEQLEQEHKQQADILENLNAGVLLVNADAEISFYNKTALQILKHSPQKMKQLSFHGLFQNLEEGKAAWVEIFEKQKPFLSHETQWKNGDGNTFAVGFSTSFTAGLQSAEQQVIVCFRDISALSNLRRQVERMERLAVLGQLSAGIAHEVRNPLAGIKSSAQVIAESLPPGDYRSQLVSRIVKEIDRSNALLQNFFQFARPRKPKFELHRIDELIHGVSLLLEPRLKNKAITISVHCDRDIPAIFVDAGQIEQVILNLLLNSIDAVGRKGQIDLVAGLFNDGNGVDNNRPATAVCLEITDTGCGIDPNDLERIFNPFFTTKANGTGLGLSISNRLMQKNGGQIDVESTAGKGTTFKLIFPAVHHTEGDA